MRLSINDWPPLASHFLCLFLGALLANWQAAPPPSFPSPSSPEGGGPYHRQKATLALPRSLLAPGQKWRELPAPRLVSLVKLANEGAKPLCRLAPEFIELIQAEPFAVIEVATGEILALAKGLLNGGKRASQRVYPLAAVASLPLCLAQPKVSYGSAT